MKHTLPIITALVFGLPAQAADLGGGSKMQPTYVETASTGSWSGFYVGGHVGYSAATHDIRESHKEIIPGTPASCKDGATLNDDGKCYTTTVTPAVEPSCKDGASLRDGKCYVNKCDVSKNVMIQQQCWHEKPSAYVPGSPETTKTVEAPDAYVPATLDVTSTVTNVISGFDTDGLTGGVRVGADYQPHNSHVVFGIFGDYNFADNDAAVNNHQITDENSWLLAGRVGAAFNDDRSLIYALAGYGSQTVNYGDIDKEFGHIVAGGGVEHRLTKNITIGIEAQHWFAEKKTIFSNDVYSATDERDATLILGTINYRFGM